MELPESGDCIVLSAISPLETISVEAVGPVFLFLVSHTKLDGSFKRNDLLPAQDSESFDDEDTTEYKFDDDLEYLRSLDPKEWKEQDHYAVLGMADLRHRATEDDIKRAYKQKILKHHPDKRKAIGEEIRRDDDYFTCITRAWEMLGNPVKRRSYDSIDPGFNDDIPEEKDAKNNFYEVMGKAFQDNSRWSEKKPVPQLGGPDTPREKVERFYSFWYEFESWREYSYLDEEDKESGQDRDMRKWIEKKNKATRAKRKKEEMTRIRSLVDTAYSLDPRIKKFQRDDKERKTAAKRAKQEAARARQLEEERQLREVAERERVESERKQSEEKARNDALKQEREAQKKAVRRERKAIRDLCKANDYYTNDPGESLKHMESVEKICELFKLARLEDVTRKLQSEGRKGFLEVVEETERKIEEERRAGVEINDRKSCTPERNAKCITVLWTENDLQLLIKAVNLFPAGTNQRWDVVANFINQHGNASSNVTRTAKEVLAKAKDLQATDFSKSSLKDQANKKAFDNFIAEKKGKDGIDDRMPAVTERHDNPLTNGNSNTRILDHSSTQNCGGGEEETFPKEKDVKKETALSWTPVEQKLLEQALKTYSATVPDRWDHIAACIPSRTKKQCMRRYKELVELVKAKKAAQLGK
ncbi:dnaJ homolog subfamily C member 2 isoform X2 [Neodiprion virginianus]|uniref:DnaJ homolog subfamily C member 2 isoform X2 n=1 Tax=Neodiprion lecontei TaxID=441921 RepID=A0ABM3GAH2_NEOLC|nr:dnaJ homolog subfamily C member 2 isoform X2 [Neodiprion fabricii]XP_046597269.1 dnaJ homolog subfamily C member 2 isoform X2 [Neodiprion lecontei]XP_046621347.1 dnaJ homolog subfamily C member 2 isoform X2 [Neodiprion virginianus]